MSSNKGSGPSGQEPAEEHAEFEGLVGKESSNSSRRPEANRRNAQKSTGPRTPDGKARSSQNAIKHGAFVARLARISKGVFEEDEEEFTEQVQALLDSLEPRDAIESAVALRITGLLINCDRLETWSSYTFEGASLSRESDEMAGAGSWYPTHIAALTAESLVSYLEGQKPETFHPSIFANFVRNFGPKPKIKIEGLWDDDHEPKTNGEWNRAFEMLKQHFWPNPSDALRWARETAHKLSRDAEAVEDKAELIAANRILHGPLELHLKYFARIRRELSELLKLFGELKQRPRPSPGKNEANEEEAQREAI